MDSSKPISEDEIVPKHLKTMSSIVISSFLTCSLFYSLNLFSIKPLISDILTQPSFTTSYDYEYANPIFGPYGYFQYILSLLGLNSLAFLCYSIVITTTIFASTAHFENKVIFKSLVTRVGRSLIRPLLSFLRLTLGGVVLVSICAVAFVICLAVFPQLPDTLFIIANPIKIPPLFLSVLFASLLVKFVYDEICYWIEVMGKGGRGDFVGTKTLIRLFYHLITFVFILFLFQFYFPQNHILKK